MTTTAVRAESPPPRAGLAQTALTWPSRVAAAFTGPVALIAKLLALGLVNAVALWAAFILFQAEKWVALGVLVAATLAIDAAYLARRAIPLKFLIPGVVAMLAFQVAPVVYTIQVAFTNYATGHILTKPSKRSS
jgi:arabinogalactan oligomer/maltooligosaccharide transport system permease protein